MGEMRESSGILERCQTCSIQVPRTGKYISQLLGITSWTTEPRPICNLWWRIRDIWRARGST